MVPPTLTAQVGGPCSIVHVLEWKEGMAILPSSNLKVRAMPNITTSCVYTDVSVTQLFNCREVKISSIEFFHFPQVQVIHYK